MSTPAKKTQQIFPNSLINLSVMRSIDEMHQQFSEALPFQHLIIDDFLDPRFIQSLAAHFPAFDEAKASNESGKPGQKCVHEEVKALDEDYCRLDALVQNEEFLNVITNITGDISNDVEKLLILDKSIKAAIIFVQCLHFLVDTFLAWLTALIAGLGFVEGREVCR